MKDQAADQRQYLPTVQTGDGVVVLAPFVGASWRERGRRYRLRRTLATGLILALTLFAGALAVLIVVRLARSGSTVTRVFVAIYALTAVPGAVAGRRWVTRAPLRRRQSDDAINGPMSILLLLFMPYLAGVGMAVVPALFGADLPGERKARTMTDALRAKDGVAEQGTF